MVRISSSVARRKGRKRLMRQVKGQFGHRSQRYRQAVRSVIKGMVYAFRDRKVRKREFRSLWLIRINAACREEGLNYSRFVHGLTEAGVVINRKMLADLAATSPETFRQLVTLAKSKITAAV